MNSNDYCEVIRRIRILRNHQDVWSQKLSSASKFLISVWLLWWFDSVARIIWPTTFCISFAARFELDNGQKAQAAGVLKNAGSENAAVEARGSYEYVDPEGHSHSITYVADENGYQPQGADIPVAPQV